METGFGDGNTAEKDSRQIYKNAAFLFHFIFQSQSSSSSRYQNSDSHQNTYKMATLAGKPITGNGLGLMSTSDCDLYFRYIEMEY